MKAIRVHEFGGPDVLRLENLPDLVPGLHQVIVRVHASGVNPVDTYIRAGSYGRARPLPYTPGTDASGVVEAVGAGVTSVSAGDRVYTAATVSGAYADQTLVDADQVYPLPPSISFAQGAGVNVPCATAYRALFQRAQARGGETVLVHGASGGVGVAAVQLARAHGLVVFGTAGTEQGRKLVREQGAHDVFDHGAADYLDQAKAQTPNGRGFDVILEMLANVNLGRDLEALAPHGRVVVIGSRGSVSIDPREAMNRDAAILGMSLFNASASDLRAVHAALFAGLENGALRPVVARELALDQAAEAHHLVMAPGHAGKIVLVP